MNYFTKQRLIALAIIALVVINISSIATIWMHKLQPFQRPIGVELPEDAREATIFFLKNELQFSDEQVEKYLEMQKNFLEENQQIQHQIGNTKRELYSSLIENRKIDEKKLTARLGQLASLKEEKTYLHFSEVKALCTEKQEKKFGMLMAQIIMRIDPMHQPPAPGNGQGSNHRPGQMPPPGQRPPHLPGQRPQN